MALRSGRRTFLLGAGALVAAPMIARRAHAQLRPVKLAWIRQFAPAALVQKEVEIAGELGLEVELVGFNRGLDGMIALQKGDAIAADCLVGYSQLCLAISQGIELTSIAGSAVGLNAIIISPKVLPEGDVDPLNKAYVGGEPWKHLVGKRIGSARGSQMEFLLRSYLNEHGIDFGRDVTFVDLKTNADQVLALQQGDIDAAALVEPSATQARMSGAGVLLAFPYDAGPYANLNSSLLVRSEALQGYPDELQVLVQAHVAAIEFYQNDRAAWVSDTAKVTLFDEETLKHLMNPSDLGLDPQYWANVEFDYRLPLEALQLFAKNLHASGFVERDVSQELPNHLNYSMLERATNRSRAELGG